MTASSPAIPAGAPPAPPPDFPRNGCCGACWGRCPRFSGVATAFLTCLGIVAGALMLASSSNLLLLPLTALPVRSPFAAARRARSRNASAALCARQTRLCTRRTLHAPHTLPHAPLHAPPPRRRRAAAVSRVRAAACLRFLHARALTAAPLLLAAPHRSLCSFCTSSTGACCARSWATRRTTTLCCAFGERAQGRAPAAR